MAKCTGKRCPMQVGYKVDECDYKDCQYRTEPITNADRIRSMTDQELAVFLSRDLKQPCDYCQLEDLEGACTETLCDDAMMKWLQQPAEKPEEDAM